MGVLCMNAVVVSLGISIYALVLGDTQSRLFGQNRKSSILLGPR